MNAETEQIIEAFENLDHSDMDDNFELYEQEQNSYYSQQYCSSSDDLNENTDTEDDAEDLIDLLTAHKSLLHVLS
jgi:hypothetical protein